MKGAAQIKVKPKIPMLTVKILLSRKNKNRVDHRNGQAILKSSQRPESICFGHSKQILELQGCEKVFTSCLISNSFAHLSHYVINIYQQKNKQLEKEQILFHSNVNAYETVPFGVKTSTCGIWADS